MPIRKKKVKIIQELNHKILAEKYESFANRRDIEIDEVIIEPETHYNSCSYHIFYHEVKLRDRI